MAALDSQVIPLHSQLDPGEHQIQLRRAVIASTIGTACSVFFSMVSNFAWVWRKREASKEAASAD